MTDDEHLNEDFRDEVEPRERFGPAWFRLASFAALAFYLLLGVLFVLQLRIDPATMPVDQRELWEASPTWMIALAGAAGASGVLGALLLVLRRKASVAWLLLALVLMAGHYAPLLLLPGLRGLIGDSALTAPIVILVLAYGIFHLALLGRRHGWTDA